MNDMEAEEVIRALDLEAHPEGGYYRETYRDGRQDGERGYMTAIYYLLTAGQVSHWHRIDADEIWHWYAGASLELSLARPSSQRRSNLLGPTLSRDERPQILVPARTWQSARSLGAWTLAGCTVAPAFEFAGFELAAQGWSP